MNREELLKMHEELCREALNLMKKKNHDYAGNKGLQPFANFERCEAMGVCKTEQGFLVRIVDKLSRLSTFVSCGKLEVDNEGYKDAIIDIVNYCILLYAFTMQKENQKNNPQSYTITSSQFLQE